MRVLLTAIRGSGHVRPLLTYAKALTDQGHEVRLATPADAAGALAEAGVHHVVTARASDAEQAAFWAGLGKITNDEMLAIACRIQPADVCLAVTGKDEVNIVAASMAKSMGARRSIALR